MSLSLAAAAMAPDALDPFVFASIHLLLHSDSRDSSKRFHSKPASSSSSSAALSKLFPTTSSSSSCFSAGIGCKRSVKKRCKSRGKGKVPLQFLKPGALAQLRDAKKRFSCGPMPCCTKKSRIDNYGDENMNRGMIDPMYRNHVMEFDMMTPVPSARVFGGPMCPQRKKLLAPKLPHLYSVSQQMLATPLLRTPSMTPPQTNANNGVESHLENLPLELLVRIVCCLNHDQLKPAFHVSRRLRQAVLVARQCHFDYTTPDRDRQDIPIVGTPKSRNNKQASVGPSKPPTPRAPRHAPKPPQARISLADMQELAVPLFNISGSRGRVRPPLPPPRDNIPSVRTVTSHRVLFYEDELCEAVAQNTLR